MDTLFCSQEEPLIRQCLAHLVKETHLQKDRLELPDREAEQLSNFERKPHWSSQNHQTIMKVIYEALTKSTDETSKRALRLIPQQLLTRVLKEWAFLQTDYKTCIELCGLILQATDSQNLQILFYLTSQPLRKFISDLKQPPQSLLVALVRCVQAQPTLRQPEVWDLSFVFSMQAKAQKELYLQEYLCRVIRPDFVPTLKEGTEFVCQFLINKTVEGRCAVPYELAERQSDSCWVEGEIVNTEYLNARANTLLDSMEREPFGHLCIQGPQGSGKMSLLTLTNTLYGKRHAQRAGIIVVTLEASFDSKNLVGTYVCSESGDFVFKKGPLTVAAEQGLWLVLRNIEECPSDLLSFMLPLIQDNKLQVTSSLQIRPKLGFRLCFLQKTSQEEYHQHEDIRPLTDLLAKVQLDSLTQRDDFPDILRHKHPQLFTRVQNGFSINQLLQEAIQFAAEQLKQAKPQLLDFKQPSVTQIMQLYRRVASHFKQSPDAISQLERRLIIEEFTDCYLQYLYDQPLKQRLVTSLCDQFNHWFESKDDPQAVAEYILKLGREWNTHSQTAFFGRSFLQRLNAQSASERQSSFVYTAATVRLLEQVSQAIESQETCLLVGETGTGKTTAVQEIASIAGKQLHVFNLNQNTDSADLLGGFKPVDFKYLLKPIYENFRSLFGALLPDSENNRKVLDTAQKCFEKSAVLAFCQVMDRALPSLLKKQSRQCEPLLQKFSQQVADLKLRARKMEQQGGFIFQFVEGTLIKSMQNGDWVLLDEVNLASESILNKLACIIQGSHVMLNERADVIDMKLHPEFRVFMCMNPPYSSAGKKQLPYSLRSKLLELYVPEMENESDIWHIIDSYTKRSSLQEQHKRTILQFYVQVKQQISKETKRGNIGLRNLCRALRFMNSAVQMNIPVLKAIFDSLFSCFASHLEHSLQQSVKQLIFSMFKIKQLPQIGQMSYDPQVYTQIEGSLIKLGQFKPDSFDETDFILTPNFSQLVAQLASVISVSDYAIILEGPTSAGKTSCINYLAKKTNNRVTRINNHMHTDVQEYLGSYVPDPKTGKLGFQEGCLVEAARKGYWVILDELNLAPSEVLEALNRLLDDNREIHIVETQKVVKAHPNFRIFATQNPTEGYGGRKELSEAFKNRFVMIKVGDVPVEQLQTILEKKCNIPPTRSLPMVKVMSQLQIYRSKESIFSGKNSTITVRDLLKWAGRINQRSQEQDHVLMNRIALEGFLVLAERSRDRSDKLYIKETIEKIFKVKLDLEAFYQDFFAQNLSSMFTELPKEMNLPPIIMSHQFKRLAVLVYKCLANKEPVLLVGETGCGKTTLCQVLAHAVHKQELFAINCHQNTETSDFIGCMRTRKNLNQIQEQLEIYLAKQQLPSDLADKICDLPLKKRAHEIYKYTNDSEIMRLLQELSCVFEWTDGILVNAMQKGGLLLIDEISLANDSVLERLNSVFERDRTLVISEKSAEQAVAIVADPLFNMVATMNPGNDFGKKELSPALRNRMTEIWVDSYFTQPQLLALYESHDAKICQTPSPEIDLYLIISSLCEKTFPGPCHTQLATGIFNLICFVNFTLADRYFALKRKALSIRDILNMIEFVRANTVPNACLTEPLTSQSAFRNAAELVIIDGLCLGIDVANESEKLKIMEDCYGYLTGLIKQTFDNELGLSDSAHPDQFINTVQHIGVAPYVIQRQVSVPSQFAFTAETTKKNLKKLLRAFSLGKPVLIEGLPGVGKTSLVENLARQTQKKLVRVNLSDQTDMMDLLGSEYPLPSKDDDIKFSWCDGVLLQAIKEGYWFLIDEMNLAQQSILEGLNAILDHRKQVYIPELNQTFTCHPDFFVFACQNPSQSAGQTSGRKTLPKSFLNRFTKIFLEELQERDYQVILEHQASDCFSKEEVEKLLLITKEINSRSFTREEGSAVNMRDLARFLKLYRHLQPTIPDRDCLIAIALETCYGEWRIAQTLGLINPEKEIQMPTSCLIRSELNRVEFRALHTTNLSSLAQAEEQLDFGCFQDLKGPHSKQLQKLADCLQADLPTLVVTNDQYRLSKSLKVIAHLQGINLSRILLNDRSDTTQLLGCFEQTSSDFQQVFQLITSQKSQSTFRLAHKFAQADSDELKIKVLEDYIKENPYFAPLLPQLQTSHGSKFEWVDSVLVKAVKEGHWTCLENANLCNASVLDRLNGLFEEGSTALAINEQGLVDGKLRQVTKHMNFRAVFMITEKTLFEMGKDVSKALRNRCQQIQVHYDRDQETNYDLMFSQKAQGLDELLLLQTQHDKLPSIQQEEPDVQLGKRSFSKSLVSSLKSPTLPYIKPSVKKAYPFLMPLLNGEQECYKQYLNAEVQLLKDQLQDKLKVQQNIERKLKHFLTKLSQAESSVCLFLVLFELNKLKQLRDTVDSTYLVYLLTQIKELAGEIPVPQDTQFLSEPVDLSLLSKATPPPIDQISSLKDFQAKQPSSHPGVYPYKLSIEYLLSKCCLLSRFECLLSMLKHRNATVLMLDQEREIITDGSKIASCLETTCFDISQVMNQPSLLVIPQDLDQNTVLPSQSLLYKPLCYLKDYIKLSIGFKPSENHRLTAVPSLLRFTHSEMHTVASQICLSVLHEQYFPETTTTFGRELILAVLRDEQTVSLKDLPACYQTSTSLSFKLTEMQAISRSKSNHDSDFDRIVKTVLMETDAVDEALFQHFRSLAPVEDPAEQQKRASNWEVLCRAFGSLQTMRTVELIKAMFILPLEQKRIAANVAVLQDEIEAEQFFWRYHLLDEKQPETLLSGKRALLLEMLEESSKLDRLMPQSETTQKYYSETNLRATLRLIDMLSQLLERLRTQILTQTDEDKSLVSQLCDLLYKQLNSYQFSCVSHLLTKLLVCVTAILQAHSQLTKETKPSPNIQALQHSHKSDFYLQLMKDAKQLPIPAQETNYLWLLKQIRLSQQPNADVVHSRILEHFVQKAVVQRMVIEAQIVEKAKLPFAMKDQKLPQAPVGKAMDTWTEKDKQKMEEEAEKEIELNFPSYFDEVHKAYYSGEFKPDQLVQGVGQDVEFDTVLEELIQLEPTDQGLYKQEYLKNRLEVVYASLTDGDELDWVDDVQAFLKHKLHSQKLKQVMNITDVELSKTYSFYHTPLPQEAKLIYQPLLQLQIRLRDITVRDGYESPLINDALFLSNYMLACFNVEATPIMKILTCLEFLLTKLDEWENTYASKRLNSVQENIDSLKMLVIRYRKIQILSWRNLLNWRQHLLIKEDFTNSVRLAHAVQNQVFQGSEPVLKILDLCDLFIRDSTLATYKPRLAFLSLLISHLKCKQAAIARASPSFLVRLQSAINALNFVHEYYKQFFPKLQQTISRLDADAREKVKLLIDIKKWTLQKFTILKDNVDKTHRQLNRACQKEEEILIQNVQGLVLEASRKKFVGHNDQLLSLDSENEKRALQHKEVNISCEIREVKLLKNLETDRILPIWPSSTNVQEVIDTFMTRMADVRALNKKNPQKRAFYDLLSYLKEEGLRSNFQSELQPMIVECKSPTPYFLKAYEVYLMLRGTTQSEEFTDLKNTDVLRCQGFGHHLMHQILTHNLAVQQLKETTSLMDQFPGSYPEPQREDEPQFLLSEASCKQLQKHLLQVNQLLSSIRQQFETQQQLQASEEKRSVWQTILLAIKENELPRTVTEAGAAKSILDALRVVQQRVATACNDAECSNREARMLNTAAGELSTMRARFEGFLSDGAMIEEAVAYPRAEQLEKKIKLFYQELVKLVDRVNSEGKPAPKENLTNPTASADQSLKNEQEQPVLTMMEKHRFVKDFQDVCSSGLKGIADIGQAIISFKGVKEAKTVSLLQKSVALLTKLKLFVASIVSREESYLDQLAKFGYMVQRVFLYLINQGFCGQEDEDDSDVEPPSDLDQDGMGMGDGKGEENVADQIENEEQLEGLKNYESDQEQQQNEDEKQSQKDGEEEDNDFEMKEDFDGEMDDDQKSEDSNRQSNEDDAEDQVDDLLDQDLWNKNQEDLEQKEEKEEKERREQDLGERELQDQNVQEREENEAAGDHEKQEKQSERDERDERDDREDEEMKSDQQNEDEGEKLSEEEDEEIGLNKEDEVPQEASSDEDMQDEESKSVNPEDKDEAMQSADEEKEEDVDSQFSEKDQEEISQNDSDQEAEDHQKNQNQAVLEDDQIQANEDNRNNEQANLKKQPQQKIEDNKTSNQNKDQKLDNVDTQQVDANGQDLLFNFAQKLQQKERQKSQQPPEEQDQPDAGKKQVDQPQMREQDAQEQDQPAEDQDDQMADEYAFDEQAQQMQGRLATEKVQEHAAQDQEQDQDMEEDQMEQDTERKPENPEEVQMTEQAAQNQAKNVNRQEQNEQDEEMKSEHQAPAEDEKLPVDLLDLYNEFLQNREHFDACERPETEQKDSQLVIIQQLASEPFNYRLQKERLREMFADWQQNEQLHSQSLKLLMRLKNATQHVTSTLCEQLRIVLEPQLSQNLQGDFKTGKRLNMKKVISFIASNYRNDKIWLRRTLPTKRDYKILIAIDDSLSMHENNLGFFSLEASVALQEALQRLEVGKVAVARIRDRLDLIQSFEDSYGSERAAHQLSEFSFQHKGQTTADTSMANFVQDANKLLDMQNAGDALSCPFVIVLSDGRFNKENVRRYMREAREKRYLYIFVILDSQGKSDAKEKKKEQGILSLRSAVKQAGGGVKLDPYLSDFPFDYYCIVQDTQQLPQALGAILVQWFSIMLHQ